MNDLSDQQLLRKYADSHSEEAFRALVDRHVDLVHSAAVRMVNDSHLAKDVTQGVFIALAQQAGQLTDHPVLAGWLHRTTQNTAANVIRTDVRRRAREEKAVAMNEMLSADADAPWENIAPHLDDALGQLSDSDRDALLLRYFERKSAQEMAETLGISDEAAQKRVNRAVDRLRELFSKRGLTVGSTALVAIISSSAVHAAPIGLSATISSGAILSGLALQSTTAVTATKAIVMTTLQKIIITTVVVASISAPLAIQHHAKEKLRAENQTLRQQNEQIVQLQTENARLSNQLVHAQSQQTVSPAEYTELLKLRGQTSQAQTATRELAALKQSVEEGGQIPNALTNAMASGLSMAAKFAEKSALAKLARMKEKLHLTPAQEEAIHKVQLAKISEESKYVMEAMTGKLTDSQRQAKASAMASEDGEIEALLAAEQITKYAEFKKEELAFQIKSVAMNDAKRIAEEFKLSATQQEQLSTAFYDQRLDEAEKKNATSSLIATQPAADPVGTQLNWHKNRMEQNLKLLADFLTPEQLKAYQTEKSAEMEQQTQLMKAFLPKKTGAN